MEMQKVSFVQCTNEATGEYETEHIWCAKDGEHYIIDNIPFVAKRISLGDTITAEYDEEEKRYYFDGFVAVSGNTTVRLYFDDDKEIQNVRQELQEKYNCESEGFLTRNLISVNVPASVDYRTVKKYLEEGEKAGWWTYEESCLAHDIYGLDK